MSGSSTFSTRAPHTTPGLGWLATAVFLEINHVAISKADNDDIYDLGLDVAASNPNLDEIAQRLRDLIA